MRDALNSFGSVALAGSTTTVVLPDVIDFGEIDGRASLKSHRTGEQHDSTVVFSIDGTLAAAVTGVKLQDSDDNSTFADLLAGPNIPSGSGAGTRIVVPFPLDHKRYVRASATAGTAGVNVAAWFEPGPNH